MVDGFRLEFKLPKTMLLSVQKSSDGDSPSKCTKSPGRCTHTNHDPVVWPVDICVSCSKLASDKRTLYSSRCMGKLFPWLGQIINADKNRLQRAPSVQRYCMIWRREAIKTIPCVMISFLCDVIISDRPFDWPENHCHLDILPSRLGLIIRVSFLLSSPMTSVPIYMVSEDLWMLSFVSYKRRKLMNLQAVVRSR